MFKVVPDTNVPGFRVGLTDDNNESARRSLPTIPSGVASGYDPYSNVLQAMVPTVVRPPACSTKAIAASFRRRTKPMSRSPEARPPRTLCDKRWTERPTLTPMTAEIRSRLSGR